jgi:uncharacterized protein (DUF305 family)
VERIVAPPKRNVQERSMQISSTRWQFPVLCLAGALCEFAGAGAAPRSAEEEFTAEGRASMDKMMRSMNVKQSGDVDKDFSAMMIPHHQGAIDMAQAELRYGRNEQLRRIAQEIIVEQQQEIAAMRLALVRKEPK